MIKTSRFILVGLLALIQMIAPLVHAHAGRGGTSGFLHLPGLEQLTRPPGTGSQALGSQAAQQELIVCLAPALKDRDGPISPSPNGDDAFGVPGVTEVHGTPSPARMYIAPEVLSPLGNLHFWTPSPRAPPSL